MVNIRFGLVVASIRKFPSPEGWNTGILWGENYHLTVYPPLSDSLRVILYTENYHFSEDFVNVT